MVLLLDRGSLVVEEVAEFELLQLGSVQLENPLNLLHVDLRVVKLNGLVDLVSLTIVLLLRQTLDRLQVLNI